MSLAEMRNVDADLSRFRVRVLVASMVVVSCFVLVATRLAYLQIVRHADLAEQAESNRTAVVPVVPNRGLILDRNGVVLATNYSAYTLEITPSKVADMEKTLDELSQIVTITARDRRHFKKLRDESKSFESLPVRTRLTDEEVAKFAAQRFRFSGVDIKARLFRNYPYGETASHVIGYIGRINQAEKDKLDDSEDASNYRGTEYIGKLGVEQSYESQLHGVTGVDSVETSAGGRAMRKLASTPSTPGNTVRLSIDIKLQHLVEELFGDRRGALVAIEPKTGEILAFVSKPTFDPNLFVEGIDSDSWQALNESLDRPLLNRALRGTYPPGSTYKPFMALAALETGMRKPEHAIVDPGYFILGGHRFRDDKEGGHGTVNMYRSIVESCDTYYYLLANDMGVDRMHDQLKGYGFGELTGIDIFGEVRGLLPSTEWKRRVNAKKAAEHQKWYAGETISLGIGQGYNNFTMLQLASAVATLANNGVRLRPHLVKEVVNTVTRTADPIAAKVEVRSKVKPENIEFIKHAMEGVNLEGTSAGSFRGSGYTSGGKTGTAQVIQIKQNEKYSAAKIDERHRDHALFEAFAPVDNPRIAVALIVENAGFGSQSAAPIARRVLDYWLQNQYPSAEDIAAVQGAQATAPIGRPRTVSEVPWPPQPTAAASSPSTGTATANAVAAAGVAGPVGLTSAAATGASAPTAAASRVR